MRRSVYILSSCALFICACESQTFDYSADQTSSTGTGGSLARFAISGNYLYTVNIDQLNIYNITDEKKPVAVGVKDLDWGVETIFAGDNMLFLGTRNGVYIFDISTPETPVYLSLYSHVQSCDPVIVKGEYAYATLSTSGPCSNGVNQLEIIDISNPNSPHNVNTISMENPRGLGISGDLLFVCDEGLKVFDLTDPIDPEFLYKITIDAFDVIPVDTLLLVTTDQGLAEYSIDNDSQIHFLSSIYTNP